MNGKPITLIGLEHDNDVALLGLMNRLRAHARSTKDEDLADDLIMASALINHMLQTRDDYK